MMIYDIILNFILTDFRKKCTTIFMMIYDIILNVILYDDIV